MPEQGVNIATLVAQLKLDLSQFDQATNNLSSSVNKVADAFSGAAAPSEGFQATLKALMPTISTMGINTGILGTVLSALVNPLTIVGVAFFALEEGARRALNTFVETGVEVRQLTALSGLGAEAASDLADTFNLMGVGTSGLQVAMYRLSAEIDSGAAGLGRLGISIRTTSGEMKTEGELFLEARDKISSLGTAAERNAALQDLFGRSARNLAPIFALNKEAFEAFLRSAGLLTPWSTEAQQKSEDLRLATGRVTLAWQGLQNTIGEMLAGPATGFKNWLADTLVNIRLFIEQARDATKASVEWLSNLYTKSLEAENAIRRLLRLQEIKPPAGARPTPNIPNWSIETETGMLLGGGTQSVVRPNERPSNVEFQAMQAELQQRFAATQNYYKQLDAERQLNVARAKISESQELQLRLDSIDEQLGASKRFYDEQVKLAQRKAGDDSAAYRLELAQLTSQEESRRSILITQRLQTQAAIAKLTGTGDFEQKLRLSALRIDTTPLQNMQNEVGLLSDRYRVLLAQFGENATVTQQAKAAYIEARSATEAYATSLKSIASSIEQTDAAEIAAGKFAKQLDDQLQALTDQAEAFRIEFSAIGPTAAIQAAAGMPNIDAAQMQANALASRIATVQKQIADLNAAMGSPVMERESEQYQKLSRAAETLRTELAGLFGQLRDTMASLPGDQMARSLDVARGSTYALGVAANETASNIQILQAALSALRAQGVGPLNSEVVALGERIRDLQMVQLEQSTVAQLEAQRQTAAVFRGAGVPGVDESAQRQQAVQAEIQSLAQLRAQWAQARAQLGEGETGFRSLSVSIDEADARMRELGDSLKGLQQLNDLKTMVNDIFGSVSRAISTSVTGVIQGTLSMRDAWARMGDAILLSIQEKLIDKAFKAMADGFSAMLDQMDKAAIASFAIKMLGKLGFNFGAGGASTEINEGIPSQGFGYDLGGAGELGGITSAGATGAVVRRPTGALIGEKGPEAVVPLEEMPGASPLSSLGVGQSDPVLTRLLDQLVASTTARGEGDSIVIIDQRQSGDIEKRESNAGGRRQMELIIKDAVKGGMMAGEFDRVFQSIYGMYRVGASR